VSGTKTVPVVWGQGAAPSAPGTIWCTAVATGVFADIGFKATGNVNFQYGADATVAPTVAGFTGYTPLQSCPLAIAGTTAAGPLVQNNFIAMAKSNLDGDALAAPISTWDSTVDHGANDCTTGVY